MIQVRRLVTNNNDMENAHIHYTEFHYDILKGIRNETHHIKTDWLTIYHTTIPFKPLETFYDRIINELLRGVRNEKQGPNMGVNTAAKDLQREMDQIE